MAKARPFHSLFAIALGGCAVASDATIAEHECPIIRVPVARLRAWTRAVLWSVAACVPGATVVLIFGRLDFRPTGISNGLLDYAIGFAVLPLALLAIVSAVKALRWLLLCVWPGTVGVYASEEALMMRLGSFGTQRYDAARLDVRYPSEFSADVDDGGVEAFLSMEEQRTSFLPRITHPESTEPLNVVILRYVSGSESEVAGMLRPVLDKWRAGQVDRADATGLEPVGQTSRSIEESRRAGKEPVPQERE